MKENPYIKQAATTAWANTTQGWTLTPLAEAIGEVVKKIPESGASWKAEELMHRLSKRIADSDTHGNVSALGYRTGYRGEWHVTNEDMERWRRFRMWLDRYLAPMSMSGASITHAVTEALHHKRLWQAAERYEKSGLTKEHCLLLQAALWDVDTSRGDWVSLHVQGKRPFGDSSIDCHIYELVGWDQPWGEDGPSAEQRERAWDLFDELVFAAPAAARLASAHLLAPGESRET